MTDAEKPKGALEKADSRTKALLQKAAPKAAQALINALSAEELKKETRIDCAKEILNRVYGKTLATSEQENEIRVTLAEDIAELAK